MTRISVRSPMFCAATIAVTVVAVVSEAAPRSTAPSTDFVLAVARTLDLPPGRLAAAQRSATRAAASRDRKSLTFRQKTVRLVVTGGPENDMYSYRIAGLRNPTLVVRPGATLKVLYANTDAHMQHNLRFSTAKPPVSGAPETKRSVGSRNLGGGQHGDHAHGAVSYPAEEFTIRVPNRKGAYSYLCTVPGHARAGMHGRLVVR